MAAAPGSSSSLHGAVVAMCFLLFFLAPTTVAAWSVVSTTAEMLNGSCIADERDALLSFKAGITSDPSRRLRSWRDQDCCRWYGVRCSTRTGHVVKLDLHNDFFEDDFDGTDYVLHWLRGKISSSILSLDHLKHLDLSGNLLGGNMPIPEFMGSLKSLTYLDLSNMNFSGPVPPQLGNLTKLVYLDIHNPFPSPYTTYDYHSSDLSWLASLHSLEHLDMSNVNLSTVVDWVHSVNTLPNLRVLCLNDCGLQSSISSLLHHNLTVLEKLELSYNSFNSLAAPNWYWDVTSLKSLVIHYGALSGPIPDKMGNLTMLETLDLEYNYIEGVIPSTLKKLCSLQTISLFGNNIGGDITNLIGRLPKCSWNSLQELNLGENNITGTTLKSILNLTALRSLDITYNYLSGFVPMEIGTLKNLTDLYIGSNNLSGVMSENHFSNLTNLKGIDLSDTQLRVMVGSDWEPPFSLESAYFSHCHLGPQIPNWFRWQQSVTTLEISSIGLNGSIPDWFWTTFSNATRLDVSYNQITGELPHNLEFISAKVFLFQSNHLTGSMPQLPRSIVILDISNNSINGRLPSNFGSPNLQVAVLFSNCIEGIIPDSICQWPQLRILDLSNNLLKGGLPDCGKEEMKHWKPSSNNTSRGNSAHSYSLGIQTLLLSNNSLSGELPLLLKRCQNLMFLDLSKNKFSGKLPAWISDNIPRLVMLRLRANNFSGHIPIETTRLSSLCILDLASNNFSGVIPQSLVNLDALVTHAVAGSNPFEEVYQSGFEFIYMGGYDDSLSFVIKKQVLDYGSNVIYIMSIDLSCNRLAGQIPEEIGSLLGLMNLNLSSNFFSGNIPDKICNLQSLESLDLSNNQLSGEIPSCLSNLTSLSYLNLSYNNLSGRIPSGQQLDTLMANDPASMYIGNPSLCGNPLPTVCPGDQPITEDRMRWHEDDKSQMDFYLSFIMGFLVGLWIIFCGLLFK